MSLTFAGDLAFWGAVWGPVPILHPLRKGKGAVLDCTHQPLLQDISILKYEWCIAMLQRRSWGRVAGNACEREALTQGAQEMGE
jgi:hypothetical protein